MNNNVVGVQSVGTVTLAASGIGAVVPGSNVPFTDLGISVIPVQVDAAYTVTVYHDGEIVETHTYPDTDDKVVCHMAYPNLIFPANIGTDSIPKYYADDRDAPPGVPIRVAIENLAAEQHVFRVYATFVEFATARFAVLTPE